MLWLKKAKRKEKQREFLGFNGDLSFLVYDFYQVIVYSSKMDITEKLSF